MEVSMSLVVIVPLLPLVTAVIILVGEPQRSTDGRGSVFCLWRPHSLALSSPWCRRLGRRDQPSGSTIHHPSPIWPFPSASISIDSARS